MSAVLLEDTGSPTEARGNAQAVPAVPLFSIASAVFLEDWVGGDALAALVCLPDPAPVYTHDTLDPGAMLGTSHRWYVTSSASMAKDGASSTVAAGVPSV